MTGTILANKAFTIIRRFVIPKLLTSCRLFCIQKLGLAVLCVCVCVCVCVWVCMVWCVVCGVWCGLWGVSGWCVVFAVVIR